MMGDVIKTYRIGTTFNIKCIIHEMFSYVLYDFTPKCTITIPSEKNKLFIVVVFYFMIAGLETVRFYNMIK